MNRIYGEADQICALESMGNPWLDGFVVRTLAAAAAVVRRRPEVRMRNVFGSLVAAGALLLAIPAGAHHSFAAAFDENKPVTVEA
jgi:hypothetical protein